MCQLRRLSGHSDWKIVEHILDGFFFQGGVQVAHTGWYLVSACGQPSQDLIELGLNRQTNSSVSVLGFFLKLDGTSFQLFHVSLPVSVNDTLMGVGFFLATRLQYHIF